MNRLVIWNGGSGKSGVFGGLIEQIEESSQVLRLTREIDLAASVRRAVEKDHCSTVVAAGGDGTVNAVVNAIMALAPDARPRLAIVPLGTANDFAGSLLIPDDIPSVVASISGGDYVPMDVVRISAGPFERFYANVAAGGNSVQVSESLTEEIKATWGSLCYVRGAIGVLGDMKTFRVKANMDGELIELDSWGVLVANGRTNAGRIPVAPLASPVDGLLDVVIVKDGDVLDMIEITAKTFLSSLLECDQVVFRQVKKLQLHSTPGMRFTLDGEVIDQEPIDFEVVPGAIKMMVGSGFREKYLPGKFIAIGA